MTINGLEPLFVQQLNKITNLLGNIYCALKTFVKENKKGRFFKILKIGKQFNVEFNYCNKFTI